MQGPSIGRTEPERAAAETSLGRCLIDGDAATKQRDRRRRGKALGISFAIEATVLALLVVIPLMTSVAQPHYAGKELVPFVFGRPHIHATPQHPTPTNHRPTNFADHILTFTIGQLPSHPTHAVEEIDDPPFPDSGSFIDQNGLSIPGFQPTNPVVRPPDEKKKPEEKRTVKVSGVVQQAQLIARIEPRYPPIAVQAGIEGTVLLHAIINREGGITALEVVSGPPLLVKAALDAVRQWRYRPTFLNGEPVDVDTSITVIFRLNR
jgi:protein TonB